MAVSERLPRYRGWTWAGWTNRLAEVAANLDYGLVLPMLGHLPQGLAYWLSDRRGDVRYCLEGPAREIALASCASILPGLKPPEIRRLIRHHYRTQAGDEVESYWYDRPLGFWEPRIRIRGLRRLRESLARGQGGLLYTAHLGSATLLVAHLGKIGLPVGLVARRLQSVPGKPAAWYRQGSHRVKHLQRIISPGLLYAGENGYFRMRRLLRAGVLMVVAVDVPPPPRRRASVTLFGHRGLLDRGLAKLYLDSRAPSFFFSGHPDQRRIHDFHIEDITETLKGENSEERVAQKLASCLEAAVLRHPQDWSQWEALQHLLSPQNGSDQGNG